MATEADIVYVEDEGFFFVSGATAVGQDWVRRFLYEEGDRENLVLLESDEAKKAFQQAHEEGLTVEPSSDFYPRRRSTPPSPDLIVERREIDGSPVLVVLARTKAGSDWTDRNRHPDVPQADPVRSVCHPDALPLLLGARREGLVVVVVEGEGL